MSVDSPEGQMVTGQRIKYKNVYDEVTVITPDSTQVTTPVSDSNTTLASGTTLESPSWSKRILDPDVQNYINFVMSDIGLSDVTMSDIELYNGGTLEKIPGIETAKSFKDLLGDTQPRSIWRFQRQKYSNFDRNKSRDRPRSHCSDSDTEPKSEKKTGLFEQLVRNRDKGGLPA